jgi:methylated-DNA-[protein]-cysteine S-methyltransferase
MRILATTLTTPIGPVTISSGPDGLVGVDFDLVGTALEARLRRRVGLCEIEWGPQPAAAILSAYFRGSLRAVDNLQVTPLGTPFQRQVWAALRRIPVGKTTTYGALAAAIGRPEAVRAVGAANGDNPVAIVVPCHRVIGADGTLVGYGGGIERKRWLLVHEKALLV